MAGNPTRCGTRRHLRADAHHLGALVSAFGRTVPLAFQPVVDLVCHSSLNCHAYRALRHRWRHRGTNSDHFGATPSPLAARPPCDRPRLTIRADVAPSRQPEANDTPFASVRGWTPARSAHPAKAGARVRRGFSVPPRDSRPASHRAENPPATWTWSGGPTCATSTPSTDSASTTACWAGPGPGCAPPAPGVRQNPANQAPAGPKDAATNPPHATQ